MNSYIYPRFQLGMTGGGQWTERSPCLDVAGSMASLSRQTKGVNIGTGCFLARRSSTRGYTHDWLARCQDNMTGWRTRVLCLRHGASVLAALKTRAQQASAVVI